MNELIIEEKFSSQWPIITTASMVLAISIFSSLIFIENTLLEGYIRLSAFAFFALAVIGLFKLRDGKVTLKLTIDEDEFLTVSYMVKKIEKQAESWDISNLATVKIDEMPNRSFYNDIVTSDRCVVIRNRNENDWTYLHKLNGRVIPLKKRSAIKIKEFIEARMTLDD
jgi:hypothetical protein